jgi:hypothetical protein
LNRLGGPSDVCQESSVQEKDPRHEQEERRQEGEAEGRRSLGQVVLTQDASEAVEKDSEVTQEYEPKKGVEAGTVDPEGSQQGSCETGSKRREKGYAARRT